MFHFSLQNSATLQTSFQVSRSNNHNQSFFICMCLVLLELEKEVLSGHKRIFQISLSSRSVSPAVFFFPFTPLLLSFLHHFPSLFGSVSSSSSSYIFSPCSVGSHAVLCEASNQHQQQDRAELASSRSKATQQREIDGLCSQMRSASLHFVCV